MAMLANCNRQSGCKAFAAEDFMPKVRKPKTATKEDMELLKGQFLAMKGRRL